MLRKRRFKHKLPVAEVNVVTLMDVLTTLLFFLILASSLTKYSVLPANSIPSSAAADPDQKPTFSLQVALDSRKKVSIFIGPIAKLDPQNLSSLERHLKRNFKGNANVGFVREIKGRRLKSILRSVQKSLVRLKRSFPNETKVVVVSSNKIAYQQLVDAVAAVRALPPEQEAFSVVNALGQSQKSRVLFPQVLIAELDPEVSVAKKEGA